MRKLMLLILFLTAGTAMAASLSVAGLRCEYRENPIGIDTHEPRLAWVLESNKRGVRQTAYEILVATSEDQLKRDRGDLWQTGRVESDNSIQVVYGGKRLGSGETCFWKVRVWDQSGAVSPWSKPARWTAGLFNAGDWQARWIGLERTANPNDSAAVLHRLLDLEGCSWIWLHGTRPGDQPSGKAWFRNTFDLHQGAVKAATFVLTADDRFQLFVNGNAVGSEHRNWKQLASRDVSSHLKPGQNVLAIEAENFGNNPAGLIGKLAIVFANGATQTIAIDGTWQSSNVAAADWIGASFAGPGWQSASEVAVYGDSQWGRLERNAMYPAPFFRKPFAVTKPLSRAIVFASALGVYELHLNGKPLGNDVLSPGWTDFSKRVHYLGYDVTEQIARGENVMGAILGDGWYASYLAFIGRRNYYGSDPRLLVQLQLEYRDGTREIIGTDETWQGAVGPIREADLLMGCVYDARAEFNGWNRRGFAAEGWQPATVDSAVKVNVMAHPGEPMRRTQEIRARAVSEPRPGVYVIDFGQNLVGWARVRLHGKEGQKVVVRHAEMLNPDGTLYTANLRSAASTDTYILSGKGPREFDPIFTFHGFQYVEITGIDYRPEISDVTGVVVHSDLRRTGWFECSEPLVNKLVLNSIWGQRGNFLDVPTDCPQRDERAGWTGDAQVFMKTACLNLDSPAFYTKWLRDLCEDSQRADGAFGDVAPHLNVVGFGNTGWTDAGPVCVWRMFEMYGDMRVLREHYDALVRHTDYLVNSSTNLVRDTGSFGDWLRLAGPQKSDAIGTAYFAYSVQVMTRIARTLGRQADAEKFEKLANDIRDVFVKKFVKADGRILDSRNETGQTLYALAFGIDLLPEDMKKRVAEQFVGSLAKENNHIATGFLGTPFILFALQKAGHPELAYQLVLNRTYPGWLQQVLWGSTTMWERWDGWRPDKGFQDPGMNSFNHYWLGCVSEWLFTQVAGIDTADGGFGRIVIRPELVKPSQGFNWVKSKYVSIRGPVVSRWKREGDAFELEVSIPANSTASVHVPASDAAGVTEGGKPATGSAGVKFINMEAGKAVFEVGSGSYRFRSSGMEKLGL
ncbi:MAG TPA: family 78 glycoside hydrolase catalytic domain [Verrucomicrobiae bacterium]|nr:family 78 glycoside hydrolase catalytic domain [Verrucomicrobiae bacterium]